MKNTLKTIILILAVGTFSSNTFSQEKSLFPLHDQIEHFSFPISDSLFNAYFENRHDPLYGTKSLYYLIRPESVNKKLDRRLPKKLKKYGYSSRILDHSEMKKVDSIFVQRPSPSEMSMLLCKPIYRDFLIFKSNRRIVAIAQLCFSCEQYILLGTIVSQNGFGAYNEMVYLKKLLYPK